MNRYFEKIVFLKFDNFPPHQELMLVHIRMDHFLKFEESVQIQIHYLSLFFMFYHFGIFNHYYFRQKKVYTFFKVNAFHFFNLNFINLEVFKNFIN